MSQELKAEQGNSPADRTLVITRVFDAPRELVFDAFTNPVHLMRWWGPNGCTVISCEADPREGGTWCISMRSPRVLPQFAQRYPISHDTGPEVSHPPSSGRGGEHEDQWILERQRGVYQEVVKPERLVFTYAFEDYTGRALHQTVVTITFADASGKTRLTLHQAIFENVPARNDHSIGWSEALQHLAEYLMRAQ